MDVSLIHLSHYISHHTKIEISFNNSDALLERSATCILCWNTNREVQMDDEYQVTTLPIYLCLYHVTYLLTIYWSHQLHRAGLHEILIQTYPLKPSGASRNINQIQKCTPSILQLSRKLLSIWWSMPKEAPTSESWVKRRATENEVMQQQATSASLRAIQISLPPS